MKSVLPLLRLSAPLAPQSIAPMPATRPLMLVAILMLTVFPALAEQPWSDHTTNRHEWISLPSSELVFGGSTRTELLHRESESWRGTTRSQIRVDATYYYTIPLRAEPGWEILIVEGRKQVVVMVPPPTPVIPVAVDTASLKESTASGWLRWDKNRNLNTLRKEMGEQLEAYALNPARIDEMRDYGRITVTTFTRQWLLNEHDARKKNWTITVIYTDEEMPALPEALDPPLAQHHPQADSDVLP